MSRSLHLEADQQSPKAVRRGGVAVGRDLMSSSALLRVLAQRGVTALADSQPMRDYLVAAGVDQPTVWADFRLGVGTPDLAAGLDEAAWAQLDALGLVTRPGTLAIAGPVGINLPTFDPRQPDDAVGFVRLTPAQHKHRFVTAPAGVGCAPDIADVERIVLTDTPLLGLRLAQFGVDGVAIADTPEVLPPLAEWLATREVVIAGYKHAGITALRGVLGPLGERATTLLLGVTLTNTAPETLAQLGIERDALIAQAGPRPSITPQILRDLHAYAVACLDRGEGANALAAVGITSPALTAAWRVGYLPSDFRLALAPAHRHALVGLKLGGNIIVPAFDEAGVVADLYVAQATQGRRVLPTLFDRPRGLIGAHIITAFDEIIVTDGLRRAARYADQGLLNVILLRGAIDAQANAGRLLAAGVRRVEIRCHRWGDAIATVLAAAGLTVVVARAPQPDAIDEDPATEPVTISYAFSPRPSEAIASPAALLPQPPVDQDVPLLTDHDRHAELAEFRAGDVAYMVQVPWDDRTVIDVRVSRGGASHPGEVDIALDQQRRRFAIAATERVDVPAERIERHLATIAAMLPDLSAGPARRTTSASVPCAGADRDAAVTALRSPDLLDRIVADLDELGWHGEEDAKRLAFLAALSRKLDDPVWVALAAETVVGPPAGLHTIADATPPEDRIQVTHLSDHALLHADPGALTHRLLVLDDLDHVTPAVATSLRVLRARGGLSATQVERDPLHGAVRTRFIEARGPVALLAATAAGRIDARLAPAFIEVPTDESPLQIAATMEAERRRRGDATFAGAAATRLAAARRRLHAIQRLVEPLPVVLPDADALAVPAGSPRARRDQRAILAIASAAALLHQHQRLRDRGCVVATPADLALARRLASLWSVETEAGLSRPAARLLTAVRAAGRLRFTMEDLAVLLPGWSRHAYRAALAELAKVEFITTSASGRGRLRTYALICAAPAPRSGRPDHQVGELAEVGGLRLANSDRDTRAG